MGRHVHLVEGCGPWKVEKATAFAFAAAASDRPAVELVFVALIIVCFELDEAKVLGTPI